MSSPETQQQVNLEEWNNPDNWSGLGLWKVYFSKRDSRVWVPRLWNGAMSPHTINMGHRWGFPAMCLIFYSATLILLVLVFRRC